MPTKHLQKNQKMFFLVLTISALLGAVVWHYFFTKVSNFDVQISESKNIIFNDKNPLPSTVSDIVTDFDNSYNKPILLYIYTTWCPVCSKQLPVINEIAREFQATDLTIITLAIDRDQDPTHLQEYLNQFGNIYFRSRYLVVREGFLEFLKKQNINYNGRVPFTALIASNGEIITKFSGSKKKEYLRDKIIKELFNQ